MACLVEDKGFEPARSDFRKVPPSRPDQSTPRPNPLTGRQKAGNGAKPQADVATARNNPLTASGTVCEHNRGITWDDDFAEVVTAWPDLSDPIRAAILAMIRVAKIKG